MRNNHQYLWLILGCALLFWLPQSATAQATGTITGQITDAASGEALPGANVVVQGTTLGTASDAQGRYILRRVPAGQNTIVVTFIGFSAREVEVNVPANQQLSLNVVLEDDFILGQDIVVVGIQRGQARAFNEQRNAVNIKNVVSAEQLERFPDPHIAAALTRVPGVHAGHDRGEPGSVRIRGLSAGMGYVTVDGQRLASTSESGRGTSVTTITTDMISSLEVTKAFTPDQHADAVAGSINLVTRRPIGSERILNATLGTGYVDLNGKMNYRGAVTYGQRNDRFSYVFNASVRSDNRLQEDIRHRWEKADFGDGPVDVLNRLTPSIYPIVRDRYGLTGNFDYYMSETSSLFLRTSLTRRNNQEERHQIEYLFRGTYDTPNTNTGGRGRIELNSRMYDRITTQASATTGGRHMLDRLNLDYSVGYSFGLEENNPQRSFLWRADGFDFAFEDSNRRQGVVEVIGGSIADPSVFKFQRYEMTTNQAADHDFTASTNLEIPYNLGRAEGNMKFGGHLSARFKDVTRWRERAIGYNGTLTAANVPLSPVSLMDGKYQIPFAIDWNVARNYYPDNRQNFILDEQYNTIYQNDYDYTSNESVAATYGMTTLQLGKLMLLGGLRMERTGMQFTGNVLTRDDTGVLTGIEPADVDRAYYNLFPAAHIRYAITDRSNLRLAYTQTIGRPGFRSLTPYRVENYENQTLSIGNPYLSPMTSSNYDLLFEHYFMNVGVLSGGLFYKDVQGFIYTEDRDLTAGEYEGWRETRPVNGEWARVWGFEAAWQQNLNFLPGALSGLGIFANYTYTGSEADYGRPEMGKLANATPHIFNTAVSYDRGGFSGQVSYNYMSPAFISTSTYLPNSIQEFYAPLYPDRYRMAFGQMDLSASQRVTPQLRVFLEITNLLNKSNLDYHMFEKYPYRENIHSWQANAGLRYSL